MILACHVAAPWCPEGAVTSLQSLGLLCNEILDSISVLNHKMPNFNLSHKRIRVPGPGAKTRVVARQIFRFRPHRTTAARRPITSPRWILKPSASILPTLRPRAAGITAELPRHSEEADSFTCGGMQEL
jgi:hypothetical protein